MWLRGVHQKRVAEIDCACRASSQNLRTVRRFIESVGRKLSKCNAGIASRRELSCDVEVRSDTNACWRIVGTDI